MASILKSKYNMIVNTDDVNSDIYFAKGNLDDATLIDDVSKWTDESNSEPVKIRLSTILDAGSGLKPEIIDSSGNVLKVGALEIVDTASASLYCYLPVSPKDLSKIFVTDRNNNAQNNPVTIKLQKDSSGNSINGTTLNGVTSDLVCDVNKFLVVLIFDEANNNWIIGGTA